MWKPRSRWFVLETLTALACAAAPTAAPRASAQVLYAISGDGGAPASTLFALDLATGAPNAVGALGNGDDGEAIAFRPADGLLYHASGGTDGLEFFETVDPDSAALGPNLAGGSYGPDPAGEIQSLVWYAPLGVFLASDIGLGFYHVDPGGAFTRVGSTGAAIRGFAVVGDRVYCVDPAAAQLFEVDPASGATLAALPLTVGGIATSGNGLATHPATGVVYALLKNPAAPSAGRLLATLDVATGAATSIGDTGLKLAGLAFRSHAPLYALSGDGATPASTLFTLDLGSAAPTALAPLGNGDDGEGLSFRPEDGWLYHTSGVSDGSEFFERVDPETGVAGANLAPGATYGPSPAREITAIGWYAPLGVFLASDLDAKFYHVTPAGRFTQTGDSGVQMRGFAVVGSRVFAANPFAHQLFEIEPAHGNVLATLPLSVDGLGTSGNALATSPETGTVFAVLKNPLAPGGGRLLAILDVSTGQATSIGDTGLKLAGLAFGSLEPAATPVPALGNSGAATLFALLLGLTILAVPVARPTCERDFD